MTLEDKWNREDSGLGPDDRGLPLTVGEATAAAERVRDPYDKMVMQFLLRRVERLMEIYEGEWGGIDD